MARVLRSLVVALLALAALFGILLLFDFLALTSMSGTASEAPTVPACNGRVFGEGFTYRFRDPRRGETVVFRATGTLGGELAPDENGDLELVRRVIGVPGDTVVGRGGRVFVNDLKSDDIATAPFPRVDLAGEQFFVLGDNRSFSRDSREFGSVPRDAIFARVITVVWPLGDVGPLESRHAGQPPGRVSCD